jgi:hypothetical protein
MDIYEPAEGKTTTAEGLEKPTIVFMFGGGFITGERNNKAYSKWFNEMKNDGYRIVSIDYRLGLKGSKKVGVVQVNVLDKAIHIKQSHLVLSDKQTARNDVKIRIHTQGGGKVLCIFSVIGGEFLHFILPHSFSLVFLFSPFLYISGHPCVVKLRFQVQLCRGPLPAKALCLCFYQCAKCKFFLFSIDLFLTRVYNL